MERKEGETTTLFVQNIPPRYHWRGLRQLFGRHGDVVSSFIVRKHDRAWKLFGFVSFSNRNDAVRTTLRLNGLWILGYWLTIKEVRYKDKSQREVDENIVRKLQKCLVGTMTTVCSSSQVEDKLWTGGLGEIITKFLGGRDFLIEIEDNELHMILKENSWSYLKEVFLDMIAEQWGEFLAMRENALQEMGCDEMTILIATERKYSVTMARKRDKKEFEMVGDSLSSDGKSRSSSEKDTTEMWLEEDKFQLRCMGNISGGGCLSGEDKRSNNEVENVEGVEVTARKYLNDQICVNVEEEDNYRDLSIWDETSNIRVVEDIMCMGLKITSAKNINKMEEDQVDRLLADQIRGKPKIRNEGGDLDQRLNDPMYLSEGFKSNKSRHNPRAKIGKNKKYDSLQCIQDSFANIPRKSRNKRAKKNKKKIECEEDWTKLEGRRIIRVHKIKFVLIQETKKDEFNEVEIGSIWSDDDFDFRRSRLDRVFTEDDWLHENSEATLWGLQRTVSDHIPILLGKKLIDWAPRPFKLINSWLVQKSCVEVIKDTLELDLSHNEDLSAKLRRMKGAMQKWNKDNGLDDREREEVVECTRRLWDLLREKEEIWRQKSRMKWLKLGDENSALFYRAVKLRSKKRLILGTNLVEANETDPSKLRAKAFNYFSTHFKSKRKQLNTVINLPFKQVSMADVEVVEALISIEEIKEAMWNCDESKAPDSVQHQMGFGSKWRGWIWECISIVRVSVLLNDSPTKEFKMHKGLRQGDSLSPFLFLMATEVLHLLLEGAMSKGYLEGIHNMAPNLFTVPKEVLLKIDKIRRGFLWGSDGTNKKMSRVNWGRMCKLKKKEGVGIIDLRATNKALLAKWEWRFANERDALWRSIMSYKYGSDVLHWMVSKDKIKDASITWRGIINNLKSVEISKWMSGDSFIWQVEDGKITWFWEDVVLGEKSLMNRWWQTRGCNGLTIDELFEFWVPGSMALKDFNDLDEKRWWVSPGSSAGNCEEQNRQKIIWHPLRLGQMKFNVDGSATKEAAGCGGVLRNSEGHVVAMFFGSVSRWGATFEEIDGMLLKIRGVRFEFTPRLSNNMVDHLAKIGDAISQYG
ncbi:hypothetical protein F3Y22_tig00110156pilonHSYRG00126 [Hibiscus syriacus]|uniref:RRM domain-containing protein n=1 Tax=Hibiscus syriacus TaxID=106335 RepID=A0A6A3BKN0_HIBSY|nr:hypothetical protein F3Y22_tig00110156pilonHSYRG00126 [Hibiscus syriacus]